MENLKMKSSIKLEKLNKNVFSNRKNMWKREYQGLKTRSRNYIHSNKKSISNHGHIIDHWGTIKSPNLQIWCVEGRDEIQTKGIKSQFNEIYSQKIPKSRGRSRHLSIGGI
jgi:hypothetical protein